MIHGGKKNLLGVLVDSIDYDAAIEQILSAARERRSFAVAALPVHGIMTGFLDQEHRYRLNHFDLVCPDGQPVRWALNLLYEGRLRDRVYGPNLMLAVCERAASEGLGVYLYGPEQTLDGLEAKLRERFPEIEIAGRRAAKFRELTPVEHAEVVDDIRGSGASILFVALGCPRQEIFTYEMRKALSMPILAVGAAFPFHAGQLKQAPSIMQDYGLEWLFRLASEPRRLWRRYVLLNPAYVALLTLQGLGVKRFASEGRAPARDQRIG